jgi:hypothetical protein
MPVFHDLLKEKPSKNKKSNSVVISLQANYTDRSTNRPPMLEKLVSGVFRGQATDIYVR